jgi:two-component sensor histidine kinase
LQIALGRALLLKSEAGNKEIDSSQTFADQAMQLSRQENYNEGIINSMLLSALILNKKHKADAGLKMAQQALAFSQKVNNGRGEAEADIVIGQHYNIYNADQLAERLDYYSKAVSILRRESDLLRLATVLKEQAELFFLQRKKTDAIKALFEALDIDKAIGYNRVQGIYWLIGRTSADVGDLVSAMKYNLLAIKAAKEVGDTTLQLCSIYNTMAFTYVSLKDYNKAIPYSLMALKIAEHYHSPDYIVTVALVLSTAYAYNNQIDKALAILQRVEPYATDNYDKLTVSAYFLNNLTYAKQYRQAGVYAQKMEELLKKVKLDNYSVIIPIYGYLSSYYIATRQIKQAYFYVDQYHDYVRKINYPTGIRSTEKRYYQLDSLQGNFKSAMKHYLVVQRITDSLDNVTRAYQISLIQIIKETEQENSHIEALMKLAQQKDTQLKRNRLVQRLIIAGSVLLLIIAILIYSRYRLKQRSNALLLKQKSEIDEQNMALQHLVEDKNQLIDDKDELLYEKDLLLKEVNHRVKNNLQIVMSLLGTQSGYMQNKQAQEAILESQNRVQSIALIHDHLFRTDKIAEIDLSAYITELVESLDLSLNRRRNKVAITCKVDPIMLDVAQAIPVGIILNEAVTNALKYAFPDARAGKIMITVEYAGEQEIAIRIADNGVGLPEGFNLLKANSLGITLISGLTGQLKGNFTVDGSDGLSISVQFPVEVTAVAGVAVNAVAEEV